MMYGQGRGRAAEQEYRGTKAPRVPREVDGGGIVLGVIVGALAWAAAIAIVALIFFTQ